MPTTDIEQTLAELQVQVEAGSYVDPLHISSTLLKQVPRNRAVSQMQFFILRQLYNHLFRLRQEQNYESIIAICKLILERAPRNKSLALSGLHQVLLDHMHAELHQQTVDICDLILQHFPQFSDALLNKSLALIKLRKYEEAINCAPNDVIRGMASRYAGYYARALEYFDKACREYPSWRFAQIEKEQFLAFLERRGIDIKTTPVDHRKIKPKLNTVVTPPVVPPPVEFPRAVHPELEAAKINSSAKTTPKFKPSHFTACFTRGTFYWPLTRTSHLTLLASSYTPIAQAIHSATTENRAPNRIKT